MGRGSNQNGSFEYVQISGFPRLLAFDKRGSSHFNFDKRFAGAGVVITKIKSIKLHASKRIVFSVDVGAMSNCNLNIEDAIAKCEIKDCKPLANIAAVLQQPLSHADELAKFKKLLDAGAISQAEYDAKKKQLPGL